jgi:hypothetical protein
VTYTPAERKLIMSVYDLVIISLAAIMASAWVGEHTNRRSQARSLMKIERRVRVASGANAFRPISHHGISWQRWHFST